MHHDRAGLLDLTNLPELDLVPKSGQHLVILRELAQVTVARTGKHIKDNGHGQTDACDQNHRCNQQRAPQRRWIGDFTGLGGGGFRRALHLHAEESRGRQDEKQEKSKKERAIHSEDSRGQHHEE